MVGGIGNTQSPTVNQYTETRETGQVGQGLDGHQAQVGQPRGRGIGRMILDGLQAIGNGILRGIANFFVAIRDCLTPRVRQADLEAPLLEARNPRVDQAADAYDELARMAENSVDFSVGAFRETCIQCMSDDQGVQAFIQGNLDAEGFSRQDFTGIEAHPTDPSKFIAKFGENQIVFSDRSTGNLEFRGAILRDKLANSTYQNLRELIEQNHGTRLDSLMMYGVTAIRDTLAPMVESYSLAEKQQLLEILQDKSFGPYRFGDVCDLSFLRD